MGSIMFLNVLLLSKAIAAPPGQFSVLTEDQPAPFDGVLFDPVATAEIMVTREFAARECNLQISRAVEEREIELTLELDNLSIRYQSLQSEYDLMIDTKDRQIQSLQDIIDNAPPQRRWLWTTLGVVSGVGTTYLAYRAFDES